MGRRGTPTAGAGTQKSDQDAKAVSKLVVTEEEASEAGEDDSTEYTDGTDDDETVGSKETQSESDVTSSEEDDDDDETETESVVSASTHTGTSDEEDEEDEDEDEDEEDADVKSDASSTHTTTIGRRAAPEKDTELSASSIREAQNQNDGQSKDAPLDLETAKAIVASAPRHEVVPPSVGAPSMIEPAKFIQNPFSGVQEEELMHSLTHDTKAMKVSRHTAPLGARQIAASEKAERMNDSDYDLILARMVAQNRKLNQDPRAMRRSVLGIGKLRQSFERLQQRNQARSEAEAEGLGAASTEFGVGSALAENDPSHAHELSDEAAEKIDWEFWGGLINDYNTILATSPIELSKAIYTGIPSALRGMMWQLLSSSKDDDLEAQYAKYLSLPCPHERSIRRDLNRTFPGQEYFQDTRGIGQEHLFNVVKAYSLYDPECGYCQGMQFIVGPLLLNMPDEEAFSTLVRLMQNYDLRGHYIPNMPSLQLRLYQFDRLVEETQPVLHLHFVRQGIKSSMYASQWFMTLVYRILDSVFAEGIEAMFRFALALLRKNEEKLITLEFEDCLNFLKLHLVDAYMVAQASVSPQTDPDGEAQGERKPENKGEPHVRTGELVRDAFAIKIAPHTLDSFATEFFDQAKANNEREIEMDALRLVNRNLRLKVQSLEEELHQNNSEHVDLVKRVVMAKLAQEEMADELVRYKVMYVPIPSPRYAEAALQNEVSGQSMPTPPVRETV